MRDAAARQAHIPVGFLPAITRDLAGEQLTDMAALLERGALGFTDDGHPVASAAVLRAAFRVQRDIAGGIAAGRLSGPAAGAGSDPSESMAGIGGPSESTAGVGGRGVLALHEEDRSLSAGGSMHEGALSAELGIPGVSAASEATMLARDAVLAGCEAGRVHFQHLSCAASVHALAAAKACGARVSAEATPHHLLLTEEDVRELNTSMKMNPPLATEVDRKVLVEALRAGTIDCVATDHAPHARAEKELPFTEAPMGTTGLETAFAALYTALVLPGVLSLGVLVERMTTGAALFELPTPLIARDAEANLTLVDLQAAWIAGEHGWQSRSENCCFAGRRLRGRVLMTLAAGSIAFRGAGAAVGGQRTVRRHESARARARRAGRRRCAGGVSSIRQLRQGRGRLREADRGRSSHGAPGARQRAVPQGTRRHRTRAGLAYEPRIEKTVFSAARAEGFDLHGRSQAIVCGIETHVCVSQTVHDLLGRGIEVHVPADAVGSRHSFDYERGLERLERAGAVVSTVESALFELLGDAHDPEFKAVQGLIL